MEKWVVEAQKCLFLSPGSWPQPKAGNPSLRISGPTQFFFSFGSGDGGSRFPPRVQGSCRNLLGDSAVSLGEFGMLLPQ